MKKPGEGTGGMFDAVPLTTCAAASRKAGSYCFGNGLSANRSANPGFSVLADNSTMPGCARSITPITGCNISLLPSPAFV